MAIILVIAYAIEIQVIPWTKKEKSYTILRISETSREGVWEISRQMDEAFSEEYADGMDY